MWPLPPISVATPGVGQSILTGLTQAYETSEYAEAVAKGFIVSCPSSNTNLIYMVERRFGTYSKNTDGSVVLTIEPGQTRQFPRGNYGSNRYLMIAYGIDGDDASDKAWVTAIMQ